MIKGKGIVAINVASGERRRFSSINEAARFLGASFQSVQVASVRNGVCRGWKIYPDIANLRAQIAKLEKMIDELSD